jgi:hypothetical protein
MKKFAFVLAAAGLMSLAACKQQTVVVNDADATNATLANDAAALDNQINAETSNASEAATNQATSLQSKTDSIRSEVTTSNTTTTK